MASSLSLTVAPTSTQATHLTPECRLTWSAWLTLTLVLKSLFFLLVCST